MTIEEAIERIKEIYRKCNEFEDCRYGSDCEICLEAVDMAISALEKQIPNRPQQDEYFKHDYICSCCGEKLAESVDDDCDLQEEMAGWCPHCGQALDWSEEE